MSNTYLAQFRLFFSRMRNTSKSLWNVPEADIHHFRFHDQMEFIRLSFDALHLIGSQLHKTIHGMFEAFGTFGTPLQPQFENVVVATALDHLIARIVADVVQFISHKKIFG